MNKIETETQQNLMTSPMQNISHNFGWLNVNAVLGWVAGTAVGETIAIQVAPGSDLAWWQHSAVVSALIVAVFMLIGRLLDQHSKNKDKKQSRDDDLHALEVGVWKTQATMKHISEFEARQRAHRFANEVNRSHGQIFILHRLLSQNGIEIPEFKPKHYEELMDGLDKEVAEFRQSLAERLDEALHKTNS